MIKRRPQGITFVETLITLAIFIIATIGVTTFIIQTYRANIFATEQAEAIDQARKGMDTMVKEIREASPAENGSYPIDTAQDDTLIFYSDIDSDEMIEKVRYSLEGTNLVKGVSKPSGFPPQYTEPEQTFVLSKYVRNGSEPVFYYQNKDYPTDTVNNPLPTPAAVKDIRLIRIFLQININPEKAPDSFTLISNSQLRNLKDNL